jgi:hypothetical protein
MNKYDILLLCVFVIILLIVSYILYKNNNSDDPEIRLTKNLFDTDEDVVNYKNYLLAKHENDIVNLTTIETNTFTIRIKPPITLIPETYSINEIEKVELVNSITDLLVDFGLTDSFNLIVSSADAKKASLGILSAYYKGFKNNFTQADLNDMFIQTGIGIVMIGLACAGLGFLTGPLSSVIEAMKPRPPPEPTISEVVTNVVNESLNNKTLRDLVLNQKTQFNIINRFLQDYTNLKYTEQSKCPPNVKCSKIVGSQNDAVCSSTAINNTSRNCMISPDVIQPDVLYDPNMILNNTENLNKRRVLRNVLTDPERPLYKLLFEENYGIIGINTVCGVKDGFAGVGVGSGAHIAFYAPFLTIICYSILYFQELSLLDLNSTDYKNPWMSKAIGDPASLWNGRAFLQTPKSNPIGLLGELQRLCEDYKLFIMSAFKTYWVQLEFKLYDNDCCGWNRLNPACIIKKCNKEYAWTITDKSSLGDKSVINEKWYNAMRKKYVDDKDVTYIPFYVKGESEKIKIIKDDPDLFRADGVEVRLIFMRLFNEYLNNPLDTLLKLRKAAGFADGNIKGKDILNKICYDILIEYDLDPTDYLKDPIDFPDVYSKSGGYPFGLNKPSYREAIEIFLNPDTPISGDKAQDAFDFGSYCTPIISVIPNSFFDISIFDLPGQKTLGKVAKCPEKSIGVMSCLKAGVSPGVVGNYVTNSRIAFCVDKKNNTLNLL